ncbi:Tetratricopeptide repeat protein 28 [Stylophora pistillata]|uniref:Tetratricopeptide repeat protein 28 n=1 Tax=Stylophora pistillata TaxID=50429 RepID=A0A2B4SZJ8_STYPI|nr:Tetratricopeptide repeat protein 28 [Stylophora pistillata]
MHLINVALHEEYLAKSLEINTEIDNRHGEATAFGNQGTLFNELGEYLKAREYHEKALAIRIEMNDREGETEEYYGLGQVCLRLEEYAPAEKHFEMVLVIVKDIAVREIELKSIDGLVQSSLRQRNNTIGLRNQKSSGVIGIARAFLESGARSVLVALWAISDTPTEQLMSRFYENLVSGESASESLHQAMKWMKNNGYTRVSEWATCMVIGDNVTFDFGNKYRKPHGEVRPLPCKRLLLNTHSFFIPTHKSERNLVKPIKANGSEVASFLSLICINLFTVTSDTVMDFITRIRTIFKVASFLKNTGRVHKAIELCNEFLNLLNANCQGREDKIARKCYQLVYFMMSEAYRLISDSQNSVKYARKFFSDNHSLGVAAQEERIGKVKLSLNIARMSSKLNNFVDAKDFYERAINLTVQNGDSKKEADTCGEFGRLLVGLSEYNKARDYIERALTIRKEIGDKDGEAKAYGNLGVVFHHLCEYDNAIEYIEKALTIRIEIGDRKGQSAFDIHVKPIDARYRKNSKFTVTSDTVMDFITRIQTIFKGVIAASFLKNTGRVHEAIEFYNDCLNLLKANWERREDKIARKFYQLLYFMMSEAYQLISDSQNSAKYARKFFSDTHSLGVTAQEVRIVKVNLSLNIAKMSSKLNNFFDAKEFYERAINLTVQNGDSKEEADTCGEFGRLLLGLSEYNKARDYIERALTIRKEIGEKDGEVKAYGNLGVLFHHLCEYDNAIEYIEKALTIRIEIGDRKGQVADYTNLVQVFCSLGDFVKAKEYCNKALEISITICDSDYEATVYGCLGSLCYNLGEGKKAKEYHEKALAIRNMIGDRRREAGSYGNLGSALQLLGEFTKAKEYLERALAIRREIGDRRGEAADYGNLGTVFQALGEYAKAKECYEKGLEIKIEIGDREGASVDYGNLGNLFRSLGEYIRAIDYNERSLAIRTEIGCRRGEALDYESLAALFHELNDFVKAKEYLEKSLAINSEIGNRKGDATAYREQELGRARGLPDLQAARYSLQANISANPKTWIGIENIVRRETDCVFLYISFVNDYLCMWVINTRGEIQFKDMTMGEEILGTRLVGYLSDFFAKSFRCLSMQSEWECEDRSLPLVIKPQLSSDELGSPRDPRLLEEDDEEEVISDFQSSLSFSSKLFIIPVADFLEEPEVIIVPPSSLYKVPFAALTDNKGKFLSETRRIRIVPSLTTLKLIQDSPADYHSRTDALIVGDPTVDWVMYKGGEQATKQAVLEKITSVSLVHFAAHGDAERGEVALSPIRTPDNPNITPQEEDYLLTMDEISQVKVRAKLVVLSCCHSGNGQIKAEGVIGIARAFLGSGARSVLVALWAISDTATEQLMSRFYEHLVSGESASESLHRAMKWMRNNGYTRVSEWAPFMLIGDDVTFDFGNKGGFFRHLNKVSSSSSSLLACNCDVDTEGPGVETKDVNITVLMSVSPLEFGNQATRNTGRFHKAVEFYKECLNLLNASLQGKKDETARELYLLIYLEMFLTYFSISDYQTSAKYARKILSENHRPAVAALGVALSLTIARMSSRRNNFVDAREFYERAINLTVQTGDNKKEADTCREFAKLLADHCEYTQAKDYAERALAISKEIGDRKGEADVKGTLAIMLQSLSEFTKAKEFYERALVIRREIGDRQGEAFDYGNLGTLFLSLGEYAKAKECHEKGLAIRIEIGDREGAATDYGNLGNLFRLLGNYIRAKEYIEKSLAMYTEMGYRLGEATNYGNLAILFHALHDFVKTEEYLAKSLAINIAIGNRKGEAIAYGNQGALFEQLGEYVKAREYHKKALAIRIEIGDREGEATEYNRLGQLYLSIEEHAVAEKHFEMALVISKDIAVPEIECKSLEGLAVCSALKGNIEEALRSLYQRFETYEQLRLSLKNNDHLKTSFLEVEGVHTYTFCSALLCANNNPRDALYVEELRRARGLADLQAAKYSLQTIISANRKSWIGIENIVKKETDCVFLYISSAEYGLFMWIIKKSGEIHFKTTKLGEEILGKRSDRNLSNFFAKSFRCLGMQSEWECEDRSLPLVIKPQLSSDELGSLKDQRLLEEDKKEDISDFQSSLSLSSKLLIIPVTDLLEETEVIIVPHSNLYKVPFAALSDKEGKYLSETRRIRIVPSLTTLKLIQDSPVDYHSRADALIVGDPTVGSVMFKGGIQHISSLPCARKEAKMVGRLVGVKPLLGEQATKQAVLQKITSVSLVHFAAHGDAERGEVALSPVRNPDNPDITPQEEDYLLTMNEISEVKVRAKLVVLSCCHSGNGQIKAEGVIGIARAFLGSGARSVLVALWAISDTATEQLMSRFYEHLVSGESASESLHRAMKWMRNNGYTRVSEWAPFMLIGDDVTFDFGNKGGFFRHLNKGSSSSSSLLACNCDVDTDSS